MKKDKTYGDHELWGLELPEGDIDGDTTLTLSLEFVEDPGLSQSQIYWRLKKKKQTHHT